MERKFINIRAFIKNIFLISWKHMEFKIQVFKKQEGCSDSDEFTYQTLIHGKD